MKQNGIRPPRGKPITTDSQHAHAVAPNMLDRNFEIAVPHTVWLADISYIPTDEGWLYLAAVKDLATMEIVGWSMSDRLKSPVRRCIKDGAIRLGCGWWSGLIMAWTKRHLERLSEQFAAR
jgi:transposase InsO family protein